MNNGQAHSKEGRDQDTHHSKVGIVDSWILSFPLQLDAPVNYAEKTNKQERLISQLCPDDQARSWPDITSLAQQGRILKGTFFLDGISTRDVWPVFSGDLLNCKLVRLRMSAQISRRTIYPCGVVASVFKVNIMMECQVEVLLSRQLVNDINLDTPLRRLSHPNAGKHKNSQYDFDRIEKPYEDSPGHTLSLFIFGQSVFRLFWGVTPLFGNQGGLDIFLLGIHIC